MRGVLTSAALAGILALTGCGSTDPTRPAAAPAAPTTGPASTPATEPATEPPVRPLRYVALGDSYTSGAGLPGSAPRGCRRAARAYPAQVALAVGATYADASCSGARTVHVLQPQPHPGVRPNPPQLDRVRADTDVVSIGLGFNDGGFLRDLTLPGRDRSEAITHVPGIGRALTRVVARVRERAPEATIVLVGYPQLVPVSGTCRVSPWSGRSRRQAYAAFDALSRETAAVAATTGAVFVDVAAASAGHDVCAGSKAWVNGSQRRPGTAAAFHPFQRGQDAVARLVVAAVRTVVG
ncbi:SGNH/GDSL hydrolase family protein [Nocardioides flavescens]|uniref:SGNH hydrolase-type esterase domain-containing protein n=1 Tax=Nocardioides flavescens TaxID=2691959 RepID=A0A6L7EZH3_9ACTN|nr:SGNH/GDSL hydrolase family protein [Nocardioides flavescens]MXG91168.1 hypothetical protein [Nocardioides flavescens]